MARGTLNLGTLTFGTLGTRTLAIGTLAFGTPSTKTLAIGTLAFRICPDISYMLSQQFKATLH